MTVLKDALDATIERALDDLIGRYEITPSILTSRGRQQIAAAAVEAIEKMMEAPPPPAGDMVLVPREPTEAMCEAGWIDTDGVTPRDIYIKMLAAAPLPAQEVTVTKGMRRGLVAAKILLANSIACVQQHHGAKAGDPLPPWLADCQRDIAALESALRPGKD